MTTTIQVGPLTLEVPADEAALILEGHALTVAYKANPTTANLQALMANARALSAIRAPKFGGAK